jgi:hypothetical protein
VSVQTKDAVARTTSHEGDIQPWLNFRLPRKISVNDSDRTSTLFLLADGNFVPANGYTVQAMHLDCRTMLGPMVKVQSAETLHRLLAYLGATLAQLADLADCTRRWGQGTVQITLVSGRRNLLRLHKWLES